MCNYFEKKNISVIFPLRKKNYIQEGADWFN